MYSGMLIPVGLDNFLKDMTPRTLSLPTFQQALYIVSVKNAPLPGTLENQSWNWLEREIVYANAAEFTERLLKECAKSSLHSSANGS